MKVFKFFFVVVLSLSFVLPASQAIAASTPKGSGATYPIGTEINPKTGQPYTEQEKRQGEMFAKEQALQLKRQEEERKRQEELQRQEEERRRQEEAARNRCSDFEYVGSNARPVSGGPSGYQCPPGYNAHMSGIICECRWKWPNDPNHVVNNTDAECRYMPCQ